MLTSVCLGASGNNLAAWNNINVINHHFVHHTRVKTHTCTGTQSRKLSIYLRQCINIRESDQTAKIKMNLCVKWLNRAAQTGFQPSQHPMLACDRHEIYDININVKSGEKKKKNSNLTLFLSVTHMYVWWASVHVINEAQGAKKTERKIWIYFQPDKLKNPTYALNRWTLCIFIAHLWQAVHSLAMHVLSCCQCISCPPLHPYCQGILHMWRCYM